MSTVLLITASQPQHTPAGRLLGKMFYSGFIGSVLSRDEYFGYPHNGGEHTLHLKLSTDDVPAFLSLVEERFAQDNKEGTDGFSNTVLSQLPMVPAVLN